MHACICICICIRYHDIASLPFPHAEDLLLPDRGLGLLGHAKHGSFDIWDSVRLSLPGFRQDNPMAVAGITPTDLLCHY